MYYLYIYIWREFISWYKKAKYIAGDDGLVQAQSPRRQVQ